MAAHGGHDEGLAASGTHRIDDGARDDRDVGDTAAAPGDGDALPPLDVAGQIAGPQLGDDGTHHVVEGFGGEALAKAGHLWERHREP